MEFLLQQVNYQHAHLNGVARIKQKSSSLRFRLFKLSFDNLENKQSLLAIERVIELLH